jgi:hypothetical protein
MNDGEIPLRNCDGSNATQKNSGRYGRVVWCERRKKTLHRRFKMNRPRRDLCVRLGSVDDQSEKHEKFNVEVIDVADMVGKIIAAAPSRADRIVMVCLRGSYFPERAFCGFVRRFRSAASQFWTAH